MVSPPKASAPGPAAIRVRDGPLLPPVALTDPPPRMPHADLEDDPPLLPPPLDPTPPRKDTAAVGRPANRADPPKERSNLPINLCSTLPSAPNPMFDGSTTLGQCTPPSAPLTTGIESILIRVLSTRCTPVPRVGSTNKEGRSQPSPTAHATCRIDYPCQAASGCTSKHLAR